MIRLMIAGLVIASTMFLLANLFWVGAFVTAGLATTTFTFGSYAGYQFGFRDGEDHRRLLQKTIMKVTRGIFFRGSE